MNSTVIVAAGDFPKRGGCAYAQLEKATRVVCCDHAADLYRRRMGREPTVVIGDGDSVRGHFKNFVLCADQDTNDLTKAIAYCAAQGWRKPLIVGATGGREDHTLGNIFRAYAAGLELITDTGRFIPVEGSCSLEVGKGTAISIFATDPETEMTSRGLVWPLTGVKFTDLFKATLNRASAARIRLTATRRVYVFVAKRDK